MLTYDYKQTDGGFTEREFGKRFSYRVTSDAWALGQGLAHEVDVLDGIRFARILGTVAYVAVDETADGSPVLDKWRISAHVACAAPVGAA